MAKGKSRSEAAKRYYAGYNYLGQRIKRLERVVAKQPDNKQAADALKRLKSAGELKKIKPRNTGGWVNKDVMPWNMLSTKDQRLPMSDAGPGDSLNHREFLLSRGPRQKMKYAKAAREFRVGGMQISKERLKEMFVDARLGYAESTTK